ncbi:MAG: tetratricopeptide repeat protein [Alphaproteobacteria bacterium]|nr:tetratricopeptide repeat protein [Alphaproteobacteria bacterium]
MQDSTTADPAKTFEQAQAFERDGRVSEAEGLYRGLLASYPGQPVLLHRLALLLKGRGALTEAESLLRRAIVGMPREAVLYNNLGNVLRAGERFADAVSVYRKAVDLNPSYAEALYNLGICLEDLNQFDEALVMHRRSVALKPDYGQARTRIGVILREQGRLEEALIELDRVIADSPQSFEARYYRGLTLSGLERFDEAAADLAEAATLKPGSFEAVRSLANNLRGANRLDEALSAYWRAMELQPSNPIVHDELNRLAWMANRPDTFLKSFAFARERQGDDANLLFVEAQLRLQRNDPQNAEPLLKRALAIAPNRADVSALYGRLLSRRGRHEEAFEAFDAAVKAEPSTSAYRNEFGYALLKGKHAKQSLEQFEAARRVNPFDQLALGGMCVAYRELGDSRYHTLVDIPSFARAFRLKLPAGYADAASFNAALSEELLKLHTMTSEPLEQTLRGGTQTPGLLFTRKSKLIEQAREAIAEAVETYIREMPFEAQHPLLSRRQDTFSFTHSWSCKLRSSGFHTNHVHSMGWISSAYYVSLPDALDDQEQRQGWLKFGESHMELGGADRPEHFVKPVVGQLVLFPSYFWHGTVPFQSSDDRLTVAFDVVPGDVVPDTLASGQY